MMIRTTSLALALLCLAGAAHAHQIWIEPASGGELRVRFGEFAENLRERSPGALDKLGAPRVRLLSATGAQTANDVNGTATADGFTLPFRPRARDAVVAEAAQYPLYTTGQGEQSQTRWYFPTARLITSFAAQAPTLALDLVPAGEPGAMQVFFEGKPLPNAKVTLVTQSGWAREKHADAQGKVRFDLPWKGLYVAEVSHRTDSAGERIGPNGAERYQGVDYVSTLSYVKRDGLAPIPAGPAALPSPAE